MCGQLDCDEMRAGSGSFQNTKPGMRLLKFYTKGTNLNTIR